MELNCASDLTLRRNSSNAGNTNETQNESNASNARKPRNASNSSKSSASVGRLSSYFTILANKHIFSDKYHHVNPICCEVRATKFSKQELRKMYRGFKQECQLFNI